MGSSLKKIYTCKNDKMQLSFSYLKIIICVKIFYTQSMVNSNKYTHVNTILLKIHTILIITQAVSFCVNFTKARATLKEGIERTPLPDWPVGKSMVCFLNWWLMWASPVHCGQCQNWVGGPAHYKKAGWPSHKGQASKQYSFTHGFSFSSWLQVPTLTSFGNRV